MILAPTNRRIIRPYDKPSFEHTQRYGLVKGHWANTNRVGLWLCNEGSGGQVFDLSGNNKTGTLAGNTHWDSGLVVCEANGDKISMPTPAFVETGTILFSFNGTGTPASFGKFFITTDVEFQLNRSGFDNYVDLYINGVSGGSPELSMSLWGTGEHIIVVTWDAPANERKIYIDGILEDTCTDAFTWDAPNLGATFYIGDRADNARNIGGRYGWFSGYNRVLSSSEIASLYREPFLGIQREPRITYFFVPEEGVVKELTGVIEGQSAVTGTIKVTKKIVSIITAASIVTGLAKVSKKVTGTIASTSGVTGNLKVTRELVGTIAVQSGISGTIDVDRKIAGTIAGQSVVSGSIEVFVGLSGAVTVQSGVAGNVKIIKKLVGTITTQSGASGSVSGVWVITGTIDGQLTVAGLLTVSVVGNFANYTENVLLEHIVGKTPFSKPSAHVGLCSSNPGETGTGGDCNEIADTNGYARVSTDGDDWNDASGGEISNRNHITFPVASGGGWGEVTHYVLCDSGVHGEGNVLLYGILATPKVVRAGVFAKFAAGDLSLVLD